MSGDSSEEEGSFLSWNHPDGYISDCIEVYNDELRGVSYLIVKLSFSFVCSAGDDGTHALCMLGEYSTEELQPHL